MLVLSYISALSYLPYLDPSLMQEVFGSVSDRLRTYWLISSVVYTASLIGVTFWRKLAAFPFMAIILIDTVISFYMRSWIDVAFNLLLAGAWFIVLRKYWESFE